MNFTFIDLDDQEQEDQIPLFSPIIYEDGKEDFIQDAVLEAKRRIKINPNAFDYGGYVPRSINRDFELGISYEAMPDREPSVRYEIMMRNRNARRDTPNTKLFHVDKDDTELVSKIITFIDETLIAHDVHDS